jgi:hypothetical protein
MALDKMPDLMRLKSQLLTSSLSQKNQSLFQVIDQLIDYIKQGNDIANANFGTISNAISGSGSSSIINKPTGISGFPSIEGLDGIDGLDGMPGNPGSAGSPGLIGRTGQQGIPGIDGIDGVDNFGPIVYDNNKLTIRYGPWTPFDASGAGLALVVANGLYIKIGPQITLSWQVVYPATASILPAVIGGVPFNAAVNSAQAVGYRAGAVADLNVLVTGTTIVFGTAGGFLTNAQMTNANIVGSGSYSN